MIRLPFLYNSVYNGMEAVRHFLPHPGSMIANEWAVPHLEPLKAAARAPAAYPAVPRLIYPPAPVERNGNFPTHAADCHPSPSAFRRSYRVEALIGQGSFGNVFSTVSTQHQDKPVGVKILRNEQECFDTGLAEVRMYLLIRQHDPEGRRPIVRMLDAFYTREHLFIVTELLNNSLFAHNMHLETLGRRAEYYTAATIGALSAQMLDALDFLQSIGVTHCDVKSANICIVDSQKRQLSSSTLARRLSAPTCTARTCNRAGIARPR